METAVDQVIESRTRELTEWFRVRRVLPSSRRRMVGPFIFFDEMGPEILSAGRGLDVAPHPHIGLATVTYLFRGELIHRDSLGTEQPIRPGAVNWMTAGRGIAHSERTPAERRQTGSELFGIQSWAALPVREEECEPAFRHYDATELPLMEGEGASLRVIAGKLYGKRSPVKTASDMFYADASLETGAILKMPAEYEERAVYIVAGRVEFLPGGGVHDAGRLVVMKPGQEVVAAASEGPARVMLLGGEPFPERRHIWWNFVSSSPERIEQAKHDWGEGRFPQVPGETESIPLPEGSRPRVVRYP